MTGSNGPAAAAIRRSRRTLAAVVLLALAALPVAAASGPGARGADGMVVTPERHATRIGVEILSSGGNAVDATVAVAFALDVTYPLAGGVGGGGFLLYRSEVGAHQGLDFRETAPAQLRAELFLDEQGRPIPDVSLETGLAVGIPGTVAGLAEAHRRWGSLPWAELLAPAIRLAAEGFEVYPWLAKTLEDSSTRLAADAGARSIFMRGERLLASGERLVQSDLAKTLQVIAEQGPAGFYEGPVARSIVDTVRLAGGVMRAEDLAGYRPAERIPIEAEYRGYRVVTFPPPSGGGIALLQMLRTLERYDLRRSGWGSSLAVHLMTEAERRAFADRARWLGDPDYFAVPTRQLLDADYLARRAASIRPDRATPSRSVPPGEFELDDRGETMHFSIVDSAGRAVSATITLNQWYGSGIVADGTGILLNNEIDDFAIVAGVPNLYGLTGGEANAVAGGKRPLSSMTPTIVEPPGGGKRPAMVLGTPGGSTIPTTILQVLVNVIDHGMTLQEAVDAPRTHHQWQPDKILYETHALPADVVVNLIARGHSLAPADRPLGNVSAIGLTPDGAWVGAADPRRRGSAEGY